MSLKVPLDSPTSASAASPVPAADSSSLASQAPEAISCRAYSKTPEEKEITQAEHNSTKEKELSPFERQKDDRFESLNLEVRNVDDEVAQQQLEEHNKILGLRLPRSWLLLCLEIVLAIAAVSAVVGNKLASHQKSTSSSRYAPSFSSHIKFFISKYSAEISSSPAMILPTSARRTCVLNTTNPSSTATATSAIPTTLGYSGCNVSNGTQYTSSVSVFTRLCNLDWSLGTDDLVYGGIRAATLNACTDECASWQGFRCLSVTYHTEDAMKNVESCFLKDSLPSSSTNLTEIEGIAGAFLNAA